MPKVKLGEPDPREVEVKAVIAAGKSRTGLSNRDIAKRIGENPRTFEDHIAHFERLHVSELWDILDVLRIPTDDRMKLL